MIDQQIKRRVWFICFVFTALFWGLLMWLMFGCSVPLKLPITSTTPLTVFETGLWGYQQNLQNSDHAVNLSGCQGQAAREFYTLKAEGYDACIMAGYKMGRGHVQASVLRNGVPLDLMDMQVTHVLTENNIWRIK